MTMPTILRTRVLTPPPLEHKDTFMRACAHAQPAALPTHVCTGVRPSAALSPSAHARALPARSPKPAHALHLHPFVDPRLLALCTRKCARTVLPTSLAHAL